MLKNPSQHRQVRLGFPVIKFIVRRNISVWAWTDEATVQEFILSTLVTLISQSNALLTNDVVAYLLSYLIEPTKSSQPTQHSLVKDLILRASSHLEYPIQMVMLPYCH